MLFRSPLGRPRRRWDDSIRMDLEEIGINAGNRVDSAQDRDYWRALVNEVETTQHILKFMFILNQRHLQM